MLYMMWRTGSGPPDINRFQSHTGEWFTFTFMLNRLPTCARPKPWLPSVAETSTDSGKLFARASSKLQQQIYSTDVYTDNYLPTFTTRPLVALQT